MRTSILFLLLLTTYHTYGQQEGIIKKFSGTIGKASIMADIKIVDTIFSGSYYNVKDWKVTQLNGSIKNNEISAIEKINDSISGYITGKLNINEITGTWQNSARKKLSAIEWKVTEPEGSAVLHVFRNQYNYVWKKNKNGDELGCKASYSLCYVVSAPDVDAKKAIDEDLLENDIEPTANDNDLKGAATEYMTDDFNTYQEDYDTAYSGINTEENEKWMNTSPQYYQWKKSLTVDVLFNENYLLTLQMINDDVAGGSPRNFQYAEIVYDLRTGIQLQLDDLFKQGFRITLTQLAQLQLLNKYRAGSMEQLAGKGFHRQESLGLNTNFIIQKDGIGFIYNPGEIASPSLGVITVMVPWSLMQQFVDPNGALGWTIKK